MIDGKILTEKLIRYAKSFLHLQERDEIYVRNWLLREFKLGAPTQAAVDLSYIDELQVPDVLIEEIETFALESNLCEDGYQELYSTYIMGQLTPYPSAVTDTFRKLREEQGAQVACDYLFNLGIKNNYIRKTAIDKNLKWEYMDGKRLLEITINLSKPEKNNKEIAKLLSAPVSKDKYPLCLLCKENEGYEGTLRHPARENIRTIPVTLGEEKWFVQYSPYAYYEEHMIAFSAAHVPMHIKKDTVDKVLDFVDYFPNYMIGSNAALPIVGGSILDHEHYQGGRHLMPMHKAPIKANFRVKGVSGVKVGIVDWYNSVIRMTSKNRSKLTKLAARIISTWENYTDDKCDIFAYSDGQVHNTLSPVCRKDGKKYIMDFILRNNRTSEEYPDGIFHAHPEYHNIKKEGIGLIEAMGLFILPGRLKRQLNAISDLLSGKEPYSEEALDNEEHDLYVHREMVKELMAKGTVSSKQRADEVVIDKVNDICRNILMNTAVFKEDKSGEAGFKKFMEACGFLLKGRSDFGVVEEDTKKQSGKKVKQSFFADAEEVKEETAEEEKEEVVTEDAEEQTEEVVEEVIEIVEEVEEVEEEESEEETSETEEVEASEKETV